MATLAARQGQFSDLIFAATPPPAAECAAAGLRATAALAQRVAVYRNNVHHALLQALRDTYPAAQRLVGAEFFAASVRAYVRTAPPTAPLLLECAAGFADFLRDFAPARPLPYLPDVARLEYLWQQSYHAAEADSLDPQQLLSTADSAQLADAHCICHPSVQTLHSDYAVGSIWQANQADVPDTEPEQPIDVDRPEWLALLRTGLGLEAQVQLFFLDAPTLALLNQLGAGARLGAAMADTLAEYPDWDAAAGFGFLLKNGFFSQLVK
ncbi:MAG: putative DNA-binding domain-containing protein [Cellvibrionales bacterium]|nr:putative DNA-binding domain-containing protein [Cellvibrionales bacterium]